MTVEEFQEKAVAENDLFVVKAAVGEEDGHGGKEVSYYQDPKGRLPLSPVDADARWRTQSRSKRPELCYQENALVDGGGFIVARSAAHANEAEWKALPQLLEELPFKPESLAADTAYSVGELRQELGSRGIDAYIPIHPGQKQSVVAQGGFTYQGDHLLCPQGKVLHRGAYRASDDSYKYAARQQDCQACPIKGVCLTPGQRGRSLTLSVHYPAFLKARERNLSPTYKQEMRKRQTVVEGVFACLDRLGWVRCKLRRLRKVDCEGFLAATAYNIVKAVSRLAVVAAPASLPQVTAVVV